MTIPNIFQDLPCPISKGGVRKGPLESLEDSRYGDARLKHSNDLTVELCPFLPRRLKEGSPCLLYCLHNSTINPIVTVFKQADSPLVEISLVDWIGCWLKIWRESGLRSILLIFVIVGSRSVCGELEWMELLPSGKRRTVLQIQPFDSKLSTSEPCPPANLFQSQVSIPQVMILCVVSPSRNSKPVAEPSDSFGSGTVSSSSPTLTLPAKEVISYQRGGVNGSESRSERKTAPYMTRLCPTIDCSSQGRSTDELLCSFATGANTG